MRLGPGIPPGLCFLDRKPMKPLKISMFRKPTFLLTALLSAALLLSGTAIAAKSRPQSYEPQGDGKLTLYRPDKGERESFVYRDAKGRLDARELEKIARFFRCRLTGEIHDMDAELIETLDIISDRFGGKEVEIISGYRSPERNALMRKKSRRVAKDSLHMRGRAADIVIKGVPAAAIRDFAYSLMRGGVGYYGSRSFVHIDNGPMRAWGWRPAVHSRTSSAVK